MINRLFCFIFIVLYFPAGVFAEEFQVSPENTTIRFELDSTWHVIHGEAHEFSGTLSFENRANPGDVSGIITIKAASLETGGDRRDKKMRSYSLAVESFPAIQYRVTSLANDTLFGELTIKEVTRPVSLKVKTEAVTGKSGTRYNATTVIQWKEFRVADPSIFIARVYNDLKLYITVFVPEK